MPTLKQKRAVEKIVENSSATLKEVVISAGYSPETAKHPDQVTKSKGFQQLLDEMLPDDLIIAKHQQLLNAKKLHGSLTEPDREVDDNQTQSKMVELGYKVKKKLIDKWEGELTLPQPLLGGLSVPDNNSNQEDTEPPQED